ncbi:AAA family ATPase [Prosthecobacter algae]|uniref:AAA family ATPase n=1 Tax=Prosthecobacter algae TaxID=1144682 RepID=A0ABP9PB97_9BACT
MRIETIRIQNFKALQDVHLTNLPGFCVFVGKNGTGKTTLFRVFAFLKKALETNIRIALQQEGGRLGFQEVVSRGHADEHIEIEIQFRLEILGTNRLVTYELQIGYDQTGARPYIKREILRYKRGRYGAPYRYLDFSNGTGLVVTNENEFDEPEKKLLREEQKLDSPDILAIKGLGQFERFKAASEFRRLIENWHISDFHITATRGVKDEDSSIHLSSSGDNLASVARHLYENERETFDRIITKMRERVPGVADVEVRPTDDGRLLMRYRDGAFRDPFLDSNVSDGTIKMFSYLVLLEDSKPHPILCVEEPENQLFPDLMTVLAEEFAAYAQRGGQVFVSSHSPDFLNAVPLESIFWLEKEDGTSTVHRASDKELLQRLVKEGDKPGWIWNQGFFDSQKL